MKCEMHFILPFTDVRLQVMKHKKGLIFMDSLKNIKFAKKFDIKTFGFKNFKLNNNYHQVYSSMRFPSGNN